MTSELKYQVVATTLMAAIEQGRFHFGEKLPSIRQLVAQHKVSKNTVLKSLEELERLGFVSAKDRAGFYVCWQPKGASTSHSNAPQSAEPKSVNLSTVFHTVMEKGAAFDCYPDANEKYHSPYYASLNKCINRQFRHATEIKAGYYDEPLGHLPLRQQIAERFRLRSTLVDVNDIVITSGCQNALYLALSAVTQSGDTVVVESPAFYGVLQLLEQLSLKVIEVPAKSEGGLDIQWLQHVTSEHKIAAVILMPNYATPTGLSMNQQDRQALVELAKRESFYLIEDDIYGELGFVKNLPPLAFEDDGQSVITCGSLSKSLSRDLRIGWVRAPGLSKQIVQRKLTTQLASPIAIQAAVAEFMAKGDYRKHLNHFTKHLLAQRNVLLSELTSFWPSQVQYTLPEGGLSIWLNLPKHLDTQTLYQTMLERNIVLTPGLLFSTDSRFGHCLRLSFHQPLVAERLNALRRLAREIKRLL